MLYTRMFSSPFFSFSFSPFSSLSFFLLPVLFPCFFSFVALALNPFCRLLLVTIISLPSFSLLSPIFPSSLFRLAPLSSLIHLTHLLFFAHYLVASPLFFPNLLAGVHFFPCTAPCTCIVADNGPLLEINASKSLCVMLTSFIYFYLLFL